jgi:alpha-ketoglutarate-dependent 2,4-dichlorophenoxyacetate dioxygenase
MSLHIEPLRADFMARATGINLRSSLSQEEVSAIIRAMDHYGVLIFPDQPLSSPEQIAFAENFGELDAQKNRKILNKIQKRLESDVIHDISNVDKSGNIADVNHAQSLMNVTNMQWHTDGAYQNYPARYSILAAVTAVTHGGETQFADTRAAYDRLDARTKTMIKDMVGVFYSLRTRMLLGANDPPEMWNIYPPVRWPLVRTHPGSGRKLTYIDSKICMIEELTIPEGRALAADLLEHATRPDTIYSHIWKPGDVVIWDNRATLHRGRRFDRQERREMRRIQVLDDVASLGYAALESVIPGALQFGNAPERAAIPAMM